MTAFGLSASHPTRYKHRLIDTLDLLESSGACSCDEIHQRQGGATKKTATIRRMSRYVTHGIVSRTRLPNADSNTKWEAESTYTITQAGRDLLNTLLLQYAQNEGDA